MGFPLGLVNGQHQQNTQRQEEGKVEVFLPLAPRQVAEALSAWSSPVDGWEQLSTAPSPGWCHHLLPTLTPMQTVPLRNPRPRLHG